MLRLLLLLGILAGRADCLFIIGCPLYGCRPSGTFSMYLSVPRSNATIAWETNFAYDPVPDALGCVANDVNIVCQSNGPFDEDKGYVTIDGWNGTIQWRDKVLRFPTLPIMDNYGDVTGSDGVSLVHYDQNGKLYPIVSTKGMKPIFSMTLVSTHFLLQVSEKGGFSVRETNAIPDAFIFLNATIQGIKGTFLPVSQPVVNTSRFYVLTEFLPDDDSKTIHVQRVYAIDVHNRMAEIMTVAWFYEFSKKMGEPLETRHKTKAPMRDERLLFQRAVRRSSRKLPKNDLAQSQNLMWDGTNCILYVILPPLYYRESLSTRNDYTFWAIKDRGNYASLAFRVASLPVTHMAVFEKNTDDGNEDIRTFTTNPVWVSLSDGKVLSLSKNGSVIRTINLAEILKADVDITSNLAAVRKEDSNSDILVMGVKISNQSPEFNTFLNRYVVNFPAQTVTSAVIAVDTSVEISSDDVIMWMVPFPGNLVIKGQISGSMGASTQRKDRIIVYAEEEGKSAKVIAIE